MRIFNLPRDGGKTTRMLYISEFKKVPILCKDQIYKEHLLRRAKLLGIDIPDPITVRDILNDSKPLHINELLIDEALMVLYEIVKQITQAEVIGMTLSDETTGNLFRQYKNGNYNDRPMKYEVGKK